LDENTSELLQNVSVCSDIPALPLDDDETEDADWPREQQDVSKTPTEDSTFMSSTRRSEVTVKPEQYLAATGKTGTAGSNDEEAEEVRKMNVIGPGSDMSSIHSEDKWDKDIGTDDKDVTERQSDEDEDTVSAPYIQIDISDLVGPSEEPVYTTYSPSETSELDLSVKGYGRQPEDILLHPAEKNKSGSFQSHSYDEGYNDDNTANLSDRISTISSVDMSGRQVVNMSVETDDLLHDADSTRQFLDTNIETEELLSGTEFLDHNETAQLLDYTPDAWLANYDTEADRSVATTSDLMELANSSQYMQHYGQTRDQWAENTRYGSWQTEVG